MPCAPLAQRRIVDKFHDRQRHTDAEANSADPASTMARCTRVLVGGNRWNSYTSQADTPAKVADPDARHARQSRVSAASPLPLSRAPVDAGCIAQAHQS